LKIVKGDGVTQLLPAFSAAPFVCHHRLAAAAAAASTLLYLAAADPLLLSNNSAPHFVMNGVLL